jgi:hypothetical protein
LRETDRHINISYLLDRTRYDLLLPGSSSKLKGGGAIIISCAASPDVSMAAVVTTASSSGVHSLTVPSTNIAAPKPEDDQALLESFVHSAAKNSHIKTTSGIGITGIVMQEVSSITSSDSFDTVMGFLEKFVQIGDTAAEVSRCFGFIPKILHTELMRLQVHPYAKLAWNVLTAAQKVCFIT